MQLFQIPNYFKLFDDNHHFIKSKKGSLECTTFILRCGLNDTYIFFI